MVVCCGMFFIGIFGTNAKVVHVGEIGAVTCPVCGKSVTFSINQSFQYFHAFFIPVFKFDKQYIATCPGCASVFALDKAYGDRLMAGEPLTGQDLAPGSLHLIRSRKSLVCPACGAVQPDGSLFCNRCGTKL